MNDSLQEQLADQDKNFDRVLEEIGVNSTDRLIIETARANNKSLLIILDAIASVEQKLDEVLREVRQERARTLFGDPENP